MFVLLSIGQINPSQRVHEPIDVNRLVSALEKWPRAYMLSRVGVMYLINVMRNSGTWSTWLAIRFNASTTVSSHVALLRSKNKDRKPIRTLIPII